MQEGHFTRILHSASASTDDDISQCSAKSPRVSAVPLPGEAHTTPKRNERTLTELVRASVRPVRTPRAVT